jgi:hypothetical protein
MYSTVAKEKSEEIHKQREIETAQMIEEASDG